MIVKWLSCELQLTNHCPCPRLARAEDDALNPRMNHRSHTHGAGLNSDVERRERKPVIFAQLSGLSQDSNLGVRARITAAYWCVKSGSDKRTIDYQHRANGYFTERLSLVRLLNGKSHPRGVLRNGYWRVRRISHSDLCLLNLPTR